MAISDHKKVDIAIVGGGMVGMTMAAVLAPLGLTIIVIDQENPDMFRDADHDGRSSALARGSQIMLDQAGIWPLLEKDAAPITDIRITDGRPGEAASSLFLHYDHHLLGPDAGPMGYIVENTIIRRGLLERMATLPAHVQHLTASRVAAMTVEPNWAKLKLENDDGIQARLVIAADGKNSVVRTKAGIALTRWSYRQTCIVGTLGHEYPHGNVAHEHFLPSGPFALLPMTDSQDGTHRSSLVWTEKEALAPSFLALSDSDFAAAIMHRFGESLGRIWPQSKRSGYKVGFQQAAHYIAPRMALIGDAAHVIHPIAGQGFNLGLRDIAALAESIADGVRLGLDVADPTILARYQRWRRADNWTLAAATDGLNRLFSNDFTPLRHMRDIGLATVDRLPPLKRLFMRHAMGITGKRPRLIKGEAL